MKRVLSLVVVMASLVSCDRARERKAQDEAMKQVREAAAENTQRQLEQIETGEGLEIDGSELDSQIEAVRKLEEASSGDEAKMAKVARMFIQQVQADTAELGEFQPGLEQAVNYAEVDALEKLDEFSEKVRIYQKANQAFREKVDGGWYQTIRQLLRSEGVAGADAQSFMEGAKTSMERKRPYLLEIRDTDEIVCEAILAQHEVLRRAFGAWSWDEEDGVPEFESEEAIEAYNEAAGRIADAVSRQEEAQRKVLEISQLETQGQ